MNLKLLPRQPNATSAINRHLNITKPKAYRSYSKLNVIIQFILL